MKPVANLEREQPWQLRRISEHHQQWFRRLIELHALTSSWLAEMDISKAEHLLPRGPSAEMADALGEVQRLANTTGLDGVYLPDLALLLADEHPEEFLNRLEHTAWAVQAWIYSRLAANTQDQRALQNQLEQASWRAGRDAAQTRWPEIDARIVQDPRSVFLCLGEVDDFLVIRATESELKLELLACPHCRPKVHISQNELCRLHSFWRRGFAYALNPRISIEHFPGAAGTRCRETWFFGS